MEYDLSKVEKNTFKYTMGPAINCQKHEIKLPIYEKQMTNLWKGPKEEWLHMVMSSPSMPPHWAGMLAWQGLIVFLARSGIQYMEWDFMYAYYVCLQEHFLMQAYCDMQWCSLVLMYISTVPINWNSFPHAKFVSHKRQKHVWCSWNNLIELFYYLFMKAASICRIWNCEMYYVYRISTELNLSGGGSQKISHHDCSSSQKPLAHPPRVGLQSSPFDIISLITLWLSMSSRMSFETFP